MLLRHKTKNWMNLRKNFLMNLRSLSMSVKKEYWYSTMDFKIHPVMRLKELTTTIKLKTFTEGWRYARLADGCTSKQNLWYPEQNCTNYQFSYFRERHLQKNWKTMHWISAWWLLVTKEIIEIKIIIIITSEYNLYLKKKLTALFYCYQLIHIKIIFHIKYLITPTNGSKMKEKNQKHTTPSETAPMPSPGYKCWNTPRPSLDSRGKRNQFYLIREASFVSNVYNNNVIIYKVK